jgi:hypothetical protein
MRSQYAIHSDMRARIVDIGTTTTSSVSHDVTTATVGKRFVWFLRRAANCCERLQKDLTEVAALTWFCLI